MAQEQLEDPRFRLSSSQRETTNLEQNGIKYLGVFCSQDTLEAMGSLGNACGNVVSKGD